MIPDTLGVIYIETKNDDPANFERVQKELDATVPDKYLVFKINGDELADLTVALNAGIVTAYSRGCEFVHWAHPDFYYEDPSWYHTLKHLLVQYPDILKICASNSRDEIGKFRIGQEQSWLMRSKDFEQYRWLFFNQEFKNIGGCEDYYQHLQILGNGYFICITPDATVRHLGAQTRSKVDTNPDQLYNQGKFGELTGFGQLVEVHKSEYFGSLLTPTIKEERLEKIDARLRKLLQENP